jgi:hypothetical protein
MQPVPKFQRQPSMPLSPALLLLRPGNGQFEGMGLRRAVQSEGASLRFLTGFWVFIAIESHNCGPTNQASSWDFKTLLPSDAWASGEISRFRTAFKLTGIAAREARFANFRQGGSARLPAQYALKQSDYVKMHQLSMSYLTVTFLIQCTACSIEVSQSLSRPLSPNNFHTAIILTHYDDYR